MKDYTTITVNNNGQPFPDTRAVDASGPLATDGTEYIKEVVDDAWLEKQAELDFYDYPPTGLEDLKGVDAITGLPNSQPLAARYMNYATPGTIVNWPSAEDPFTVGVTHGIDLRLILLFGQGIDRTMDEYKMLDSIVYIGDGDNATADSFYHANDVGGTIRNTAGDYLILPDLRGYSFRGLDTSGSVDPDGAGRIVGSKQDDAFQGISGSFFLLRTGNTGNDWIVNGSFFDDFVTIIRRSISVPVPERKLDQDTTSPSDMDEIIINTSEATGAKSSTESRGKNMATQFAIHY